MSLHARTAGDLAELCGANPRDPQGDAKINYCHGFAQGVVDRRTAACRRQEAVLLPQPGTEPHRDTERVRRTGSARCLTTGRCPRWTGCFSFWASAIPASSDRRDRPACSGTRPVGRQPKPNRAWDAYGRIPSERDAHATEAADRRCRAVAARIGRARRLREKHRAGRRERAERVVTRVGDVLRPGEQLDIVGQLVPRAEVQREIAGQRRRQIGLVAEQVGAARCDRRGTDGPLVRHLVVHAELDLMRRDAGQPVAGLNGDVAVGIGCRIVAGRLDEAALIGRVDVGVGDIGEPASVLNCSPASMPWRRVWPILAKKARPCVTLLMKAMSLSRLLRNSARL